MPTITAKYLLYKYILIMESEFLLKDFSKIKFSSKKITSFLKKNGFYPSDVRDFGEVPGYLKYFEEYDTTVHIHFEPLFNDHYPDNDKRTFSYIIFTKKNSTSFGNRIALDLVDKGLLELIRSEIENLK